MPEVRLGRLLQRAAGFARGVRFLDRHEQETFLAYETIYERALRVAGGLTELGIGPGDRVVLILPTAPSFFDAFFGALLAGAVPVPLYPPFRLGRLDEYHERTANMVLGCGARLVLTDRQIRRVLGLTIERARPELGCLTMDEVPLSGRAPAEVSDDDVALIQYSSGTTVAPKPVALTHRQISANVAAILDAFVTAYPEDEELTHAGVSWLPLYHDMGLIGCVLTAVMHPGDLTLIGPEHFVARPSIWLRAISRYRATISPAPNFAYALCADRIEDSDLEGVDLSTWRIALNGSEPVTPTVLDRFVERFRPYGLREEALTPVYGLAEAALAVTFSDLKASYAWRAFDRETLSSDRLAKPATDGLPLVGVGRPLPGFDLRILTDDGEAQEGRVGRVQVRGPSVMAGYHGMPAQTDATLRDGWLDTGDTGFVFAGSLYLYGRAKDLIIVRGRNYAPQDIEQVADTVPGARPGCVAAIGVLEAGADSEDLVILAERGRAQDRAHDGLADAIKRRVVERTGLLPARVVVLAPGTLPRTSSGKIRRGEARRQYLASELAPPQRVTVFRLLLAVLRSWLSFARRRRAR